MGNFDNKENMGNLELSLTAWSKTRLVTAMSNIDGVPLKDVLKSFYEYKLLEYTAKKEYASIEKLEWVLELLELTETKLTGK